MKRFAAVLALIVFVGCSETPTEVPLEVDPVVAMQGAEVWTELATYDTCEPIGPFTVCLEGSGRLHRVVTPSGVETYTRTQFTETLSVFLASSGEFLNSRTLNSPIRHRLVRDGEQIVFHDNACFEFSDDGATVSTAYEILRHRVNGETRVNIRDVEAC